MFFVGVICEKQNFEILKRNINKIKNKKEVTLININKKSIENFKNVKFDAIVVNDSIQNFHNEVNTIKDICKNIQYLIINSDIQIKEDIFSDIKANIITCGVNHKSTVTFSSVTDELLLISVQRSFKDKKGKLIEVGEYNYKIKKSERTNLIEVLDGFIITKLYDFD